MKRTGKRGEGSIAPMVEAIERLRSVEDERTDLVRAEFVETRLAKRIFQLCRRALLSCDAATLRAAAARCRAARR